MATAIYNGLNRKENCHYYKSSIILDIAEEVSRTILTRNEKFGAINEARHVFIENGMANFSKSELSILEIGFGTGLNALLTLIYASENKLNVNYTTFEKYPLDKEVVAALNFDKLLEDKNNYLVKIHDLEWEKSHQITGFFNLEKKEADVLDKNLLFPGKFDLIYFTIGCHF